MNPKNAFFTIHVPLVMNLMKCTSFSPLPILDMEFYEFFNKQSVGAFGLFMNERRAHFTISFHSTLGDLFRRYRCWTGFQHLYHVNKGATVRQTGGEEDPLWTDRQDAFPSVSWIIKIGNQEQVPQPILCPLDGDGI